jgi:aspartyl-tRNA(Asn)/glutamyl-tRNA(Gln) amidotransferase subunit A
MIEHSLQAIRPSLASKEISSVELTQLYLDRIARHNPQLNAYLTVDPASSLGQAQAADERLARRRRRAADRHPDRAQGHLLRPGAG